MSATNYQILMGHFWVAAVILYGMQLTNIRVMYLKGLIKTRRRVLLWVFPGGPAMLVVFYLWYKFNHLEEKSVTIQKMKEAKND